MMKVEGALILTCCLFIVSAGRIAIEQNTTEKATEQVETVEVEQWKTEQMSAGRETTEWLTAGWTTTDGVTTGQDATKWWTATEWLTTGRTATEWKTIGLDTTEWITTGQVTTEWTTRAYAGPVAGISRELAIMLSRSRATAGTSAEVAIGAAKLDFANSASAGGIESKVTSASESDVESTANPETAKEPDPEDQGYLLSYGASNEGSHRGLTEAYAAFVKKYRKQAQILAIEYGIPWEAVMAQGIVESSKKDKDGINIPATSDIARDKNNFFGIGAYDDDPYRHALSYSSPEAGWRGYYENICKQSTYRENGVFKGNAVTNPHSYLQCITKAGYSTESYVEKVDPLIYGIERYARNEGWYTSAELAEHNPEMLENATRNMK